MKPKIYYKSEYEGMTCYECDTDFSLYDYSPSLTLYKKGWYREHENEIVIAIRDIMVGSKPRTEIKFFDKLTEANKFIKDYIKNAKAKLKKK